jgi:hypothetical protein
LKCEAAKQAFLTPHRCFPAAQPRCESLPSSRSRSSACRLLSEVMVAMLGGGRAAGISFRRAHAVSRKGEHSRDWLAAPQPSPAASLFINQGEHFGAFPRQPLRLRLTREAIRSMRAAADRLVASFIVMRLRDCSVVTARTIVTFWRLFTDIGTHRTRLQRSGLNTSSDVRVKPCEVAVSALSQRSLKRHVGLLVSEIPTNSRGMDIALIWSM